MFAYSSSETVIPSLVFTKAELVYALMFLMNEIPDTDNSTRIEMVELRHYLTQIKDRVSQALTDGTIRRGMTCSEGKPVEDNRKAQKPPEGPSMADLRRQFPSLTEEEIAEVLDKARAEQRKRQEEDRKNAPPPPPSFIAKPEEEKPKEPFVKPVLTPKEKRDRENSRKFMQMLGAI